MNNVFVQEAGKPEEQFALGVVTATAGGLKIKLSGEETAREKSYKRISSYNPAINDRVILAKISGTYVVLGKVV